MSGRSLLNGLLGLLALGALGFGAILAATPTTLPPAAVEHVTTLERAVEPDRALFAIGAVVGLFALWRAYFSGASDVRDRGVGGESGRGRDPSGGSDPTQRTGAGPASVEVVGEETTDRVSRTIRGLKRGESEAVQTSAVVEDLRRSLRAVEAAHGRAARADERIRRGEWTDDRIAATFLGDESAGRLSIWHRLRTWLFPGHTFERRLQRTLEEVERHALEADATVAERGPGRLRQDERGEPSEDGDESADEAEAEGEREELSEGANRNEADGEREREHSDGGREKDHGNDDREHDHRDDTAVTEATRA